MESIIQAVGRHARDMPQQRALIVGEFSLSYADLWLAARRAARWLGSHGVAQGDRVLLLASARDRWFAATYLGVHLSGAVAVPLDVNASETLKQAVHEQVRPAFALTSELLEDLQHAMMLEGGQELDDVAGLPIVEANDVADILFTSGSTGQPKGVVLTHRNIAAATRNIIQFIGNDASDREVVTVPLYHSFGLGRLRCNLVAGSTLVIVPGLKFPSLVFRALRTHRATGLSCVPTGAAVLLGIGTDKLRDAASQLKYMELGSAPMDREARLELMRLLPTTRICMHYGLTEASRSAFIEFHADKDHLDSVGKPTPNVQIAVRDADGSDLPAGSVGRIHIFADTVMKGYWRDDARSRRAIDAHGWLDTGDMGYLDADGYLFLRGRSDDLINVGGKKVYPTTVEQEATACVGVAESACVGIPDPDRLLGQVPVLYWVPEAGEEPTDVEILNFLAARLEPHAMPKKIHRVAQLPKTASGKLLRSKLRAQAIDETSRH